MLEIIVSSVYLAIPLLIAGSFHMLVVSKNWVPALAVPINNKAFGENKTWRGVIVMTVFSIPGVTITKLITPVFTPYVVVDLTETTDWYLGTMLGLAYVLFELPNSYVKRRLNIRPGEQAKKNTFLFSFIDQADSAVGCAIIYWLLMDVSLAIIFGLIFIGPVIHLLANIVLYSLGLRKHPT